MNLKQKIEQINKLKAVETPWEVMRVFGKVELFGSQVCMRGDDCRDYVDLEEFRLALKWLVEQSGGYIVWDESVKKEKKK